MAAAWKWTAEAIAEEASRFCNRGAFRMHAKQAYAAATRQGILDDVCAHMRPPQHRYSDDELCAAARRYETMKAFIESEPHKADKVGRHKRLREFTSHMHRAVELWTPERIRTAALQCDSRREFSDLFSGASQAARRMKIMDDVCSHMPLQRSSVYVYAWNGVAYVGISSSPFKYRRMAHRERQESLGDLARATEPQLLTKTKLPRSEAEALEKAFIAQYAKTHKLLNIAHNALNRQAA